MDTERIDRVAGSPEVVACALVEVGDVDVTAHPFDSKVSISVEDWIMTNLCTRLAGVLDGELLDKGGVVWGVVVGEITHVCPEFHAQHFGHMKDNIGVGE